eukprot:CAMPEP_0172167586 /NCGR_PEP_ID=MMETSP1050-20130122/9662_1 /TAXON_ID=233186 /ORGANISM="Cryptomonas curvata, Strain CCAP979/52" /LENGTH=97 /DNA_ID=CAMNT_0012838409 /DNA_START=279 /DNA_END=569 /DNA_ORIENTATION=+
MSGDTHEHHDGRGGALARWRARRRLQFADDAALASDPHMEVTATPAPQASKPVVRTPPAAAAAAPAMESPDASAHAGAGAGVGAGDGVGAAAAAAAA